MTTTAVVTMVLASLVLGGGLLVSIASAVRAERRAKAAPSAAMATAPSAPAAPAGPATSAAGAMGDETAPDGSPRTDLPPTQPRRGTGPAAAFEVAADGTYDRPELERFVAARVPDAAPATIADVLDLLDEHLMAKGIAEVPTGHRWRFYDLGDPRVAADGVVDTEVVTADAVRKLHLDAVTVDRILDAEHAYLDAKGLTG